MKTWWSTISNHKDYNKHSGMQGKKFITVLLRDGESVLDVGCGSGILYEQMKQYVKDFKYTGVDITDEFVAACKDQYPEADFREADMRDLSMFSDNSFDTVVNYHAIECCADYKQAVKETIRVAKKRAIVCFWKGLSENPEDIIKVAADGVTAETMISARVWFAFLKEIGYYYAPWIELYTDATRYNLYFVFDKEFHRADSGVGMDYLTQK